MITVMGWRHKDDVTVNMTQWIDEDSDDVMIMAVYFWATMIGASMQIIFDYATEPVI